MDMKELLKSNFNILLLSGIYIALLATTIWMTFQDVNADGLNWIRTQAGTLQGALLAIVTGRLMYFRKEDNGNGHGKDTYTVSRNPIEKAE